MVISNVMKDVQENYGEKKIPEEESDLY